MFEKKVAKAYTVDHLTTLADAVQPLYKQSDNKPNPLIHPLIHPLGSRSVAPA
jgi:hypothetical protein